MLYREGVERQISEMWDALEHTSPSDPESMAAHVQASEAEKRLRAQLAHDEAIRERAPLMYVSLRAIDIWITNGCDPKHVPGECKAVLAGIPLPPEKKK